MTCQTADADLVSLEQSVFRHTLSHGLIDIAIACFVALFAIGPYITSAGLGDFWGCAVFIPFWGLAAIVLRFIHHRSVRPRLGHVQFARLRRKRLLAWNIITFVFCVIALVVGVISGSQFGLLPPMLHTITLSIFVLVGFALAGYYLDVRRFYIYGVVIASAPFTGELLWRHAGVPHHGYPVTFGFATAFCLLVGIMLLVRFVLRYPLPDRSINSPGA